MKRKAFTTLKKQLCAAEFDEFARKIACEYANSEQHFSRSYFVEHYNISEDCFYKLRDYAVVMGLVSEADIEKMIQKSVKNQQNNCKTAGGTTIVHFRELIKKRNEHVLLFFTNEQIKEIAIVFAEYSEVSRLGIAKKNGINVMVVDLILKKAIIENLVSDEVFYKIKNRILENASKDRLEEVKKTFDTLWKMRKANGGTTLE